MQDVYDKISTILVEIQAIKSSMMSRLEIETSLDHRVHTDTYLTYQKALEERMARLENGPQRMIPWMSLFASLGCGGLALLIAASGVLISYLALHK